MKFGANVNLDNRNIEASIKIKKEEGENDFFSNLFGDKEVLDIIDDEDEVFGDED